MNADRNKLGQFIKGNKAWNDGFKYGKYTETSCVRFRRDPEYYIKELEDNAKRIRKEKYEKKNPNRIKQIQDFRKLMNDKTGAGRRRKKWIEEEKQFLRENYEEMLIINMALKLERSWISVEHKMNRMGLTNYNRWKANQSQRI